MSIENWIKNPFKETQIAQQKYYFIDRHVVRAFINNEDQPIKASIETKVTLWIMGLPIIIVILFAFIMMLPLRLYADIKFIFWDLIKYLEKR
jgi:hypothetical protein